MDTESILQRQYFAKANDAYREGNYKLCIVYLKKLKEWDRLSTSLLVESSYTLWKERLESSMKPDKEAAEIVQEAFTLLLSNNELSNSLIVSWDYIRLSHIYVVEGNLVGAMGIINIASERGYMEDLLIVTQSAFIMYGLNNEKEVQRIITYLLSVLFELSLTMKATAEDDAAYLIGDRIPFYYLGIICATYLQKRSFLSEQDKKATMKDFRNIVRESYFYATREKGQGLAEILQWYNTSDLWIQCGDALHGTPFLLLAEAFYWEAFLRAPLLNQAMDKIMDSMRRYKREYDIPRLLAKALVVNPWNMTCRIHIKEFEAHSVKERDKRAWTLLFDAEDVECTKIQCHVRGWSLRRKWPVMLPRLREIRRNFLLKMTLSDERYQEYLIRYHRILMERWRQYIRDWQAKKEACALRIQTRWRTYWSVKMFHAAMARVRRANGIYFDLCHRVFATTIMHHMRKWQDHYLVRKKIQSATLITSVLFLYGYNQKLVKGMNEVLSGMRVHYKHVRRRMFAHWRNRYEVRQKKHARVTIRFFLRAALARIEEKRIEEQLKIIEQVVAEKKEIKLERNTLPVLRTFFQEWLLKYRDRMKHYQVIKMAYSLQQLFLQRKARARLQILFLRRESQRAYLAQHRFRTQLRILLPWRYHAAAQIIQRGIRCFVARCKHRYRQRIDEYIQDRRHERSTKSKKRTLWLWKKHNFLYRREKYRAIRWVLLTFRKAVLLSKLRLMCLRKPKVHHLLSTLHRATQSTFFRFWRDRAKIESQMKAVKLLSNSMFSMVRRRGLQRWQRQLQDQWTLRSLAKILINRRIDTQYWPGCHLSVEILCRRNTPREQQVVHPLPDSAQVVYEWEYYVPRKLRLISVTTFQKRKAFAAWMATYRRLQQFRYNGAYYQARLFQRELNERLALRMQANLLIQTQVRMWHARRVLRHLRNLHYKAQELQVRRQRQLLFRSWVQVCRVYQFRQSSWPVVVAAFRIHGAKQFRRRLEHRADEHARLCRRIDRSSFQKSLVRRVMQQWIAVYCQRLGQPAYDLDAVFQRQYAHALRMQRQGRRLPLHRQEEEEDDDETVHSSRSVDSDEDYLNPRLKKVLAYQKRLQERQDGSSLGSNNSSRLTGGGGARDLAQGLEELKTKKNKKRSRSALKASTSLSRFVSSSVLFFRSEAFHEIFHQVRTTEMFLYNATAVQALQEQEVYYCLQHASVVVLSGLDWVAMNLENNNNNNTSIGRMAAPTIIPLKHIGNAFQGPRVVVQDCQVVHLPYRPITTESPSLSHQEIKDAQQRCDVLREYLRDMITGQRRCYERDHIDRSKWPLSLPTAPVHGSSSTAAGESSNQKQRRGIASFSWLRTTTSHLLAVYFARQFLPPSHAKPADGNQALPRTASSFLSGRAIMGSQLDLKSVKSDLSLPTVSSQESVESQESGEGIAELKVDIQSLGLLGLFALFLTLKSCRHVKRLQVHLSPLPAGEDDTLQYFQSPFWTHALRELGENIVLEQMQFVGAPCSPIMLRALRDAVQHDLPSLSRLQLVVHTEHLKVAQEIVDAAKMRSYSAYKRGVSVYIDETEIK